MSTLTPTATHRKRWTRDDCAFLERSGLLMGNWELLDGEIVVKMPQNYPHANAVSFLLAYCFSLVGPARVRTQATMEVYAEDRSLNRPEPDVLVLRESVRRVPLAPARNERLRRRPRSPPSRLKPRRASAPRANRE